MPLTLTTQFGVDIQFTTAEMALQIQDFRERILVPMMAAIANRIDKDCCGLFSSVYNLVGTAGSTPASQQVILLAGQKLNEMAAPIDDNRACVLGSAANAGIVNGLVGLFNPMGKISDNYDTGNMGNALGFKFSLDQNIQIQTNGILGGSPAVNGANQGITAGWAASTNLVTNGWTAAAATRLLGGEVFTIVGLNAVNPQSPVVDQFIAAVRGEWADGIGCERQHDHQHQSRHHLCRSVPERCGGADVDQSADVRGCGIGNAAAKPRVPQECVYSGDG